MELSIEQKVQKAVADMSSKVSRDGRHIYTDNETGMKLQGVSTVSSIVPKDWLAAWGAKEAVKALGYSDYEGDLEKAEEVLEHVKSITSPKQWIAFLKEHKGAHARKSKQALVDGKAGHEWLQSFVEAKIDRKEIPQLLTGDLFRPINQFLDWEKENVDRWLASEAFVYHPEKRYAGQLDAIALVKSGGLALVDFKFANFLGEDYYLQTAGYAAPFEAYGIFFDERLLVRLPKTLERKEWNEKEFKYEKKPNNIEVVKVPTKYEADRDAFFAALIVKGWINYSSKLA